MPSKLYIFEASPGARAVQMLAKNLGVDLELYTVDGPNGEHLKPQFLKLNPTHTIPVLQEENGFVLWESHAILIYLVEKYGKNDFLYPKEGRKRALVNQRLFFEASNLFTKLLSMVKAFYAKQKTVLAEEDRNMIQESYDLCEALLKETQWIAGDEPTIADFSIFSTISSLNLITPINVRKHSKLAIWVENCESKLPGTEANKPGLMVYREIFKMFGIVK